MKLLLHIGLPKAASSTLQREVFCQQKLGFDLLETQLDSNFPLKTVEDVIYGNDFTIDLPTIKQDLNEYIDSRENPDLISVISQEKLIGLPDDGPCYTKRVANRLNGICPDAKILIVIREQRRFVLSCYNQRIRNSSNVKLERFIGSEGYASDGYPAIMDADFLKYDKTIEYYESLFGSENVIVLVFEELVKDFEAGVNAIRAKFGMTDRVHFEAVPRRNSGEGMATVECMRLLNTFCGDPHAYGIDQPSATWFLKRVARRGFNRFLPNMLHIKQHDEYMNLINEFYGDLYRESNTILSQKLGVDLRDYGYM
ncbi:MULTISPECIES: hypothetical protein [unclassified Lentimonas]|uniref:hypothetical protein n=1 Tax=unclassified Lentimonas TaxID=2630993 RepID=UPI00132125E3|nr:MULTISPECIES: hypothetical protein [unclassified Lentimonas]CAA6693601.1 Unannotated [Lentimonas sp. CC10]CAA6696856.1 Unannotated [Lentimonas sp. CC19]CAA7071180.1 Unannotated [Lentimonas sp. CC11]